MKPERSGLSEEAAALLEAARAEYSPQEHELANVKFALRAKLARAPASDTSACRRLVQYVLQSVSWQWLTATALASGLAVGAATLGSPANSTPGEHTQPQLERTAPRAAPRSSEREEFAATPEVTVASNTPEPRASRRARETGGVKNIARAPQPTPRVPNADSLEQETNLLRQARARFESRDANGALRLLDRHAARFPQGTLQQEQLYLRVLALCALERAEHARAVAGSLSPLYRQRPSCVGTD